MSLPGTLIVLAAAASLNGQVVATAEKQIVVVSPAAYPRAVFVCPRNEWVSLELGAQPVPAAWTIGREGRRPLGVNVVRYTDTLANGWRVRRADGSEGIQLVDGSLFTDDGIVQ